MKGRDTDMLKGINVSMSTRYEWSENHGLGESFLVETLDTNEGTEIWLFYKLGDNAVYPKVYLMTAPKSFDCEAVRGLIEKNLGKWQLDYRKAYLAEIYE